MITKDYVLVIGRFQIPTFAHFELFKSALEKAENLIIGIGSSNLARSLKNPFSYEQRAMMIENCGVPEIEQAFKDKRIRFIPLEDSPYSDQWWLEQVQRKVKDHAKDAEVAILGCNKDESSYYIKMFPQWDLIEVEKFGDYNATDCRNAYYEHGPTTAVGNKLTELTTQGVVDTLKAFPSFIHESLNGRWKQVQEYREEWGEGPFDTVDAVVLKNGHILCIRRGGEAFNNDLWALPGGFLEKNESYYQGSLRELEEETGLKADWHEDRHWLPVSSDTFDKKDRDDRAHIITTAFCYNLVDTAPLPEVEGKDDAIEAKWVPIADLRADNMYGDHYFIMRKLTAGL